MLWQLKNAATMTRPHFTFEKLASEKCSNIMCISELNPTLYQQTQIA
jgi:hypothetical protein